MSILIKGMEMPTSCLDCPMNYDSIDCKVNPNISLCDQWYEFLFDVKRHKDCPLVEIPPHGDLIDKSDLMKLFQDEERYGYIDALDIVALPTIIEAEDGE